MARYCLPYHTNIVCCTVRKQATVRHTPLYAKYFARFSTFSPTQTCAAQPPQAGNAATPLRRQLTTHSRLPQPPPPPVLPIHVTRARHAGANFPRGAHLPHAAGARYAGTLHADVCDIAALLRGKTPSAFAATARVTGIWRARCRSANSLVRFTFSAVHHHHHHRTLHTAFFCRAFCGFCACKRRRGTPHTQPYMLSGRLAFCSYWTAAAFAGADRSFFLAWEPPVRSASYTTPGHTNKERPVRRRTFAVLVQFILFTPGVGISYSPLNIPPPYPLPYPHHLPPPLPPADMPGAHTLALGPPCLY